ncbi:MULTISPECIES: HTTM domain-containing protein [Pontibacter]|uniref:Vitamin K-dependent gamma-carboxylase n=1 Tax=Pontibacter lucknowensis TaxID=1077936 RepID=A0A1N7B8D6_9BACT|nr:MULTISPECIES: HTTM domain-containing protein [Pontibacter]EJF09746.1 HTTM domain-containing protein [Pontibacter sp. BAB1700]SIR47640.1 Vitamin K-dependent gamma-carboxylase [Pontibacter lucknowensis]
MHQLQQYLRRVFTVDLRALAVMRIWVAGIILTDLAIRATDLEAHYSNMGVLPLHVLHQFGWHPYHFSFHTLSGLWQVQVVLFLIAAVFAIFLLLGYKTRTATIVSWILLVSLQNRNTFIAQGGDDLLRMLLFWGMFLPWGKFYSYDAAKAKKPEPLQTTYFSAATAAYILQIFLVYFCTALLKSSPEWNLDGTALYYALSLDQILMPVGKLIYPYPELLRFLTLTTWYTELLLPFLLLIPFYNHVWRLIVVGVLFMFHIGISLTLFVGLFYLINIASISGLLPPQAMNWAERKLLTSFRRPLSGQFQRIFKGFRSPAQLRLQISLQKPLLSKNQLRYAREGFVTFVLIYCIWWNLSGATARVPAMPDSTTWFGNLLRVDQRWGMFAPAVFKDDGWYVLEGHAENGQLIDLNREGKEADYAKPASVVSMFKNDRWRKYSENYLFVHYAFLRPYYCNYLVRRWNEAHPGNPIKELQVVYMKEYTLPDYQPVTPQREVLCTCANLPE